MFREIRPVEYHRTRSWGCARLLACADFATLQFACDKEVVLRSLNPVRTDGVNCRERQLTLSGGVPRFRHGVGSGTPRLRPSFHVRVNIGIFRAERLNRRLKAFGVRADAFRLP